MNNMRRLMYLLLAAVMLLAAGCGAPSGTGDKGDAGYDVTDIEGTVVHMPDKPKRILTLSMSTDEVMLGLVEPERMVAVNALLDDPVSSNVVDLAKKVPKRVKRPSAEEVAALRPDLVIVPDWGNMTIVPSLRDLGLKVVVCKGARNLKDIRETIALLAAAIGEPEKGDKLLAKMDSKLSDIQSKLKEIPEEKRGRSVLLLSLMKNYGGTGSSFDEACQLAGVTNARAAIGINDGTPMTKEQMVESNPDIIFLPTYNNHGKYDIDKFRAQWLDDPALQTIGAIRDRRLEEPFEGYIYNCSQDFVFAVQEIAWRATGDDRLGQSTKEHLSVVGE